MADGALLPGWLLWSLPAMFLLHDAEEVLFLPPWLRRNREWLARRFPQLARRMLLHFDGISPLRFAAMAAEELVLLVAVTACAAPAASASISMKISFFMRIRFPYNVQEPCAIARLRAPRCSATRRPPGCPPRAKPGSWFVCPWPSACRANAPWLRRPARNRVTRGFYGTGSG